MKNLTKYWDIISGIATGLGLAVLSKFELDAIQLYYSIIILILVSIGIFKIIKQAIEKNRETKKKDKRKDNLIDGIVGKQTAMRAVQMAQKPTKDGEEIGNLIIIIWRRSKKFMKKFKEFLDKYKGYFLTGALTVLTIVEEFGGFINQAFGGTLVIGGYEVLPIITLVAAIVVGCISNGYSKDQKERIKALLSKSTTNELVRAEIKKTLKENDAKLKEFNKTLSVKETELENLEILLTSAKNTHEAKKEMYAMTPRLATAEDVQLAANEVVNYEAKIVEKKKEIDDTKKHIDNLTTTNAALKEQL